MELDQAIFYFFAIPIFCVVMMIFIIFIKTASKGNRF